MYIIRIINKDTSSHSWKSMLSYLHSYGRMSSPALCLMLQLVPLTQVPCRVFATSIKKFLLALYLGDNVEDTVSSDCKVAAWFSTRQIIQSTYKHAQKLCLKLLFSRLWHSLNSTQLSHCTFSSTSHHQKGTRQDSNERISDSEVGLSMGEQDRD